jgi:hypothetical protein
MPGADLRHKNTLSPRDRLATIAYYRRNRIPDCPLLYPKLLHSTPVHSHSIVPGGLLVTSYVTRLIPLTSFTIRPAT